MLQNDDAHLELVNSLIDTLNELKRSGYSASFLASAAVSAAAAYSVFNHRQAGVLLTDQQLDRVARQFREKMVSFERQTGGPPKGTTP